MISDDDARDALERVTEDARRASQPDLDWQAVEARLLERLEAGPRLPIAQRTTSRLPWVLAAAAMACAAALALAGEWRPGAAPGPVARERSAAPAGKAGIPVTGTVDGSRLATGAVVTAANDPVVVEHPGHATWTLEPRSEAHLASLGDVVTIALDRGTLSAHVVKSPRPESFVVIADHARIAVHGTRFRVERVGASVRVSVTEGVVAVGPVGAQGIELFAPASTTVTLEGVRADAAPTAPATLGGTAGTRAAAPADVRAVTPPQSDRPRAQKAPRDPASSPQAESSVQGVIATVQRCFGEHTASGGDLKVTVLTSMTLRVGPNGRLGDAVFTPPLAPGVRRCVDASVGSLGFPSSAEGFAVARTLQLEH